MRSVIEIGFAAVLLALAGSVQAQEQNYLPDTGTKEIDFSGSITFKPTDSQNVNARFGYFLDRRFEVGIDGAFTRVENNPTTEHGWAIGGFANYHFPQASPLLPYVGAFAGVSDRLGGDTSGSLGLQGGAKYFFNPNVAGFAEFRWRTTQFASEQTGVFAGLAVFFK